MHGSVRRRSRMHMLRNPSLGALLARRVVAVRAAPMPSTRSAEGEPADCPTADAADNGCIDPQMN